MKADLHCHTMSSRDSLASLDEIAAACGRKGVDCLAITDHNRLTLWSSEQVRLIPGEEVMTTEGELIGLFLTEEIPPHLSPLETVDRIKAQGGLVYLPHPFDRFRRSSPLRSGALAAIAPYVDIVEGLNARNVLAEDDRRAVRWALARGLPIGAGSDAHAAAEIGTAYVELGDFSTPQEFLARIAAGRIGGRNSPIWVHLYSLWAKWTKRLSSSRYL